MDVDQTLLDWTSGFLLFMEKHGLKPKEIVPHGDVLDWFHISFDEAKEYAYEYARSEEHFGTIPSWPGAEDAIETLHDDGYRFVAITAVNPYPVAYKSRSKNLKTLFGDVFDDLHLIGFGNGKKPVLKQYEPTYWVEDSFHNAVDGAEIGHYSFLLNHPQNIKWGEHDKVHRVDHWNEIVNHILDTGN